MVFITISEQTRLFPQIDLVDFLITLLVLILSIAVHEFAHAWSAMKLGDRTAYYQGRVTLDPMAHLEPMGTMMMVFSALTGFGIGWGKPVPVDPRNLRFGPRVGMAITAAAGPVSNVLQAIVWGIPLRLVFDGALTLPDLLIRALLIAVAINLGLALFNLIPLFPLDGFNILRGALATIRARWAYDVSDFLDRLQPYAPMVLLLLIFLDQTMPGQGILSRILVVPAQRLRNLIIGV
jgi:Zn-dependent protease